MSEHTFRGQNHLVFLMNRFCVLGAVPMVGRRLKRLLERRGGPWSPPPLVSLILVSGKRGIVMFYTCLGVLGNQICVWLCRPSELSLCSSGMSASTLLFLSSLAPREVGGHRHNDLLGRRSTRLRQRRRNFYDFFALFSVLTSFQVLG